MRKRGEREGELRKSRKKIVLKRNFAPHGKVDCGYLSPRYRNQRPGNVSTKGGFKPRPNGRPVVLERKN